MTQRGRIGDLDEAIKRVVRRHHEALLDLSRGDKK